MNTTKAILGILAVGAAGVAVGMLLAPQKGSDLRKSIKDSVGGKIDDLMERAEELSCALKEQAEGLKKDAKQRYENVKNA